MDFQYVEDEKYFVDLLADGDEVLFNENFLCLFDFRDPEVKRAEFNKIRNKIFHNLINKYGQECQLKLVDNCEVNKNLVVDHYIPLSTNELNKKLRHLQAAAGKKIESQSFGSNHENNFILACSKCNGFKKHRIIKRKIKY